MKQIITLLQFSLLSILIVSAQDNQTGVRLPEINIEGERAKILPDESRIVTILDREDINNIPVQSIDELLDRIAGLDARQRGTGGVQTDVSVRGGSFDQVLILLNGVNITDPQTGHYNLDIPVELSDVSQIEILQGSAARVYGVNGFSGVINIITGKSNRSQIATKNEAGSYGYLGQSVSGTYFTQPFQTFASVSFKSSNGFIDNTDYKITNGMWQSSLNTNNLGYFHLQLATQIKDYGANSFYTPKLPNQFESTKTFLGSLQWNFAKSIYTLNAQSYWRVHFDKFNFDRYSTPTNANYHRTDVAGGKLSAKFDFGNLGETILGFDLRNEHIFSNNLGTPIEDFIKVPFVEDSVFYTKKDNRLIMSAAIDHSVSINSWKLSGGFSTVFNKQFGVLYNGGGDIAYTFHKKSRIYAAVNSATRLPTFTDLYYQTPTQISNPELKPEKSITLEIGEVHNFGCLETNAALYYRKGQNIIDWVKQPDEQKWQSKNITNVNAWGADINLTYKFQNRYIQSIDLAYSLLNLDKAANGYDSKYALDYLKNKIVIGLNHTIWKNLSAHWNAVWYERGGNYTDYITNKLTRYKPYALLNSRISWQTNRISVYFDTNNILNQSYVEFGGLEQPKINFIGGVQLRIL